jgi:hypothetical protein
VKTISVERNRKRLLSKQDVKTPASVILAVVGILKKVLWSRYKLSRGRCLSRDRLVVVETLIMNVLYEAVI